MLLVAGAGGVLVGAAAVALLGGAGGSGGDRARVETIVHEYILAHPEILPEAMKLLQQRDTARVVEANRAAIETPFGSAWAGAEKGDVVLVEFFDYACGFCRASNADVDRLLKEDSGLKVVWRELPVLGEGSRTAAEASLAAAQEGKFRQFYDRQFAAGRPSAESVAQVRRAVGVTMPGPPAEASNEIAKNYELARVLGATGTPTFVVGDKVLQGAVGYDALKAAIAAARAG